MKFMFESTVISSSTSRPSQCRKPALAYVPSSFFELLYFIAYYTRTRQTLEKNWIARVGDGPSVSRVIFITTWPFVSIGRCRVRVQDGISFGFCVEFPFQF